MPLAGFEPIIPASEGPRTSALDGAATGIGQNSIIYTPYLSWFYRVAQYNIAGNMHNAAPYILLLQ